MNPPESLVPKRETCELLLKAGFPQDTYFCWRKNTGDTRWILDNCYAFIKAGYSEGIAAPTFEEIPLLRAIPTEYGAALLTITTGGVGIGVLADGYSVDYILHTQEHGNTGNTLHRTGGENLAEKAAQMLLWLISNGYFTFEQREIAEA